MLSARRGFSLVELLVVLGILVTLGAIGAGAFISSGRGNRLAGTEQLITSALRQARYTARATGQAVLIYIDKDLATISGVSRYPVWQTSCEDTAEPFRTADPLNLNPTATPPDSFLVRTGRSGSGFGRPQAADANKAAAYTFFDASGTGDVRNRARQITPNKTGPTTGFQLTCAAYLPSLSAGGAAWYPLVCVDGAAGDAIPASDSAYAGLVMRRRDMPMYGTGEAQPTSNTSGLPTPAPAPLPATVRPCYDLVGWITVGGTPISISSVEDAVDITNGVAVLVNNSDKAARRIGYAGNDWEEVSFVLSGTSLELYRGGLQVAKKTITSAPRVDGTDLPHRLVLGSLEVGSGLAGTLINALPASAQHLPTGAWLDDAALVRLGRDQSRQLPNGVTPYSTYAVLVRPDGRMSEVSGGAQVEPTGLANPTSGALRLIFSGVQNERDDYAVIEMSGSTGTVETSLLKLTRTATP